MRNLDRVLSVIIAGVSLGWTAPSFGDAQGTIADYRRAETIGSRFGRLVEGPVRSVRWSTDGTSFWFRRATGRRVRFLRVDVARGTIQDLFDHERMAAVLGRALGQKLDAKRLPIQNILLAPKHIDVWPRLGKTVWRVDLERGEAKACDLRQDHGFRMDVSPDAYRSVAGRAPTLICFTNRSKHPVGIHWLTTDGNERSYGSVAPGKSRMQPTFAGHAWVIRAAGGNKRALARFVATDFPGTAFLENPTLAQMTRAAIERAQQHALSRTSRNGKWHVAVRRHNVVLGDAPLISGSPITTDGTAKDGFVGRVYWSPNATHFVIMRRKRGDRRHVTFVEAAPKDQLEPRVHSFEYAKPGDRLDRMQPWLFDVRTKSGRPIDDTLFANPWSITHLEWSPKGDRFSFLYNQRGHQILRLLEVDAATRRVRTVLEERSDTFIDYAGKLFVQRLWDRNEVLWMSERDGWNHLYVFDAENGRVKRQLTGGDWAVRDVDRVDLASKRIWFRASGIIGGQDPYYVHYCRVGVEGEAIAVLTEGDGHHVVDHPESFSPDGRFFIDTWSRVDRPPTTVLRRSEDGKAVVTLQSASSDALRAAGWRPPLRFVAKGRDDTTDIHGVIYRPTTFDAKSRYPVVEAIYAGPHGAHVPKSFRAFHDAQRVAELGFIVVQIDGMGTSHRSKAFHDVCWRNLHDAGFPDRIRFMRAAAAKFPWMDLTRVGIYGGSAGGQNAMRALIDHGDFYHVAVADCGCHDNRMDKRWWNELWMGWPVGDHYKASSNVVHAHRMQGKLMLIVGAMDRNVDPASTMQVVDALVKADKDFDLVVIPNAGHGAAGTRYGRRRLRDFLVRHLLGVEPRREK